MILLIDNYDSFTYNLFQLIAQREFDVKVIRNDALSIEEIQTLQPKGIVLSPGPGHPQDAGLCVEIVQAFASEIPILGVCLGLQAIVVAFGGEIIKAEEIVHGKSCKILHKGQGIYHNLPSPFRAGRYHSLIANRTKLPVSLVIEAKNEAGIIMGIKHKNYLTYGVQFHPESILTPCGSELIKNFINTCKQKEAVC